MNNIPNGYSSKTSSVILIAIYFLERFSYYGMIAILLTYMSDFGNRNLSQDQTTANYAWFTLAIKVMPFFMGLLSDFFLRRKQTILIGGFLSLIGYVLLIPASEYLFLASIIPISFGLGLLRTNLIVMLGRIFKKSDKRRNTTFLFAIIFINLSAFISMFSIGSLVDEYGFSLGFVLMISSTLFYLILYYITKDRLVFIEEDHSIIEIETDENILDAEAIPSNNSSSDSSFIYVVMITLLANFLFWKTYNIWFQNIEQILSARSQVLIFGIEFPIMQLESAVLFILIITTFLIGFFWQIKDSGSSIYKLAYALLIAAIVVPSMYFLNSFTDDFILYPTFALLALMAIGETFTSSITLSYITRASPTKYSATIIGLYLVMIYTLNRLWSFINFDSNITNYAIPIIALLFGIILFVSKKEIVKLVRGLD